MSKTRIHVPEKEVIEFRTEIQERLRRRVQEAIHLVLEEELTEALGCPRYERDGERRGYRNGRERRTITTTIGARELEVPRGRIFEEGGSREFRSRLLPRYARRTREVDDAILSCYLAGANSRKIRKAQVRCWGTAICPRARSRGSWGGSRDTFSGGAESGGSGPAAADPLRVPKTALAPFGPPARRRT